MESKLGKQSMLSYMIDCLCHVVMSMLSCANTSLRSDVYCSLHIFHLPKCSHSWPIPSYGVPLPSPNASASSTSTEEAFDHAQLRMLGLQCVCSDITLCGAVGGDYTLVLTVSHSS